MAWVVLIYMAWHNLQKKERPERFAQRMAHVNVFLSNSAGRGGPKKRGKIME